MSSSESSSSEDECSEFFDLNPSSSFAPPSYNDLTPTKHPSMRDVSKNGEFNRSEGNFNGTVHEIIDIDPVTPQEIVVNESAEQQGNVGSSSSVIRRTKGNDSTRSPSFKKQARLSRMLQDDESSSDEEKLYSIGTIPPRSVTFTRPSCDVYQPASPESKDGGANSSDVPNEKVSGSPQEGCETKEEVIPMQLLSTIVKPDVLNKVKSQLKVVEERRKSFKKAPIQSELTPAKLWEMRKKQQNESILLNKTQSSKIKAGWKIRQCLANLPDGDDVNTLYLTLVGRGMLREVDALFSLVKVIRDEVLSGFDKNYLDEDGKSALTIAIDKKDESMMRKLMEHGLDLELSIFHAIEADFMEGLKLILAYRMCTDMKVEKENLYFQIGMTPMLFAAHNNNYHMLSLLYQHGHRLTELKDWSDGIHVAWESSNERRMICLAMAQPAYITLTTEVYRMNPMKYCLREIKRLRIYKSEEHEFSSFYEDIIGKYEEYMCSLLDFICSSDELADLFQFDRLQRQMNKNQQISTFIDGAKTHRSKVFDRFQLLEKASRENLVKFVTHQQSQLALSHMRYRSLPLLRNNLIAFAIGILFPFLSIFYICAPDSALGGIITLPIVSFYCHMMSDIVFAILLLMRIVVRDTHIDRLGEPLTPLEWLILVWIIGKWVQEFQECINRGLKAYLRDYWNYTDLTLLSLFSAGMFIRIYDIYHNANLDHISRYQWGSFEPRLIGEGLQAWGYVFVFIRLLGLMRVDRSLGPLQISLGKMLADIVRFLFLFALVLGAFAFGLSDLYWYYGTSEGSRLFCNGNTTDPETNTTRTCSTGTQKAFTSIPSAMVDLFWALFGLFDLDTMSLNGKHVYTEYIGKTLVATYHVVAIIVMLNMLIAMMSKSYEDTTENAEIAWKFHRTAVWIRFIRREVVRPPPMNLFPNPWRMKENFWRFKSFFRNLCSRKENLTVEVYDKHGRRKEVFSKDSSANSTKEKSKPACACFPGAKRKSARTSRSAFEFTNQQHTSTTALISQSIAKNSSLRPQRTRMDPRFSPAALSDVKNTIRHNFRVNESKRILDKLVRRYKIKNLIKRKT